MDETSCALRLAVACGASASEAAASSSTAESSTTAGGRSKAPGGAGWTSGCESSCATLCLSSIDRKPKASCTLTHSSAASAPVAVVAVVFVVVVGGSVPPNADAKRATPLATWSGATPGSGCAASRAAAAQDVACMESAAEAVGSCLAAHTAAVTARCSGGSCARGGGATGAAAPLAALCGSMHASPALPSVDAQDCGGCGAETAGPCLSPLAEARSAAAEALAGDGAAAPTGATSWAALAAAAAAMAAAAAAAAAHDILASGPIVVAEDCAGALRAAAQVASAPAPARLGSLAGGASRCAAG